MPALTATIRPDWRVILRHRLTGDKKVDEFIAPARPLIGDEERAAVDRVLLSGMLAQGPEVAAFESEFADHFKLGRPCVAVNSGTSGLHLGLLACGVGPGDEIVVPSFTFAATANSVALTGATPVFADIDPLNYCLDPTSVKAALTDRTVGVMPVHLYGHPAGMSAFEDLAAVHGLEIYEDAAQAHGASLYGRPVGSFGRFAMFSLYPTKNMTSGEGGMVSVADSEVDRLLRLYRNQGMQRQYENEVVGFNARMTDLHAAIGRVQLRKIDGWNVARRSNARFLDEHLEGVTTPTVSDGAVHVYHQYTVRIADDRDGFARALREEYAVGCGMFYPTPNHRLPSFQVEVDLPHTERAARECLSLPVHPSVGPAELERIVNAVNSLAKAGG
jgi:perosamine synthetase